MFRCTDAFIYGYLIGLNINIPRNKNKNIGGNKLYICNNNGPFATATEVEQGRGGGIRGENGKPMPGDVPSSGTQLCGTGAGMNYAGSGGHNGEFGYGGNGAAYLSSGGGAGWYGGGSSIIHSGGGGGSGFIWCRKFSGYVPSDYTVPDRMMAYNPKLEIGNRKGNGLCIIENTVTGEVTQFDYTGKPQEYKVIEGGIYKITCYGAQGGSFIRSDPVMSGGLGGFAYGEFPLLPEDILYIYVGKEGGISSVNRPFGGGGVGTGGCSDGGGATDVRLKRTADIDREGLCSRLIVGGGGGGVGQLNGGETPLDLKSWTDLLGTDPNKKKNDNTDTSKNLTFDLGYVLISDLSVLHCDMYYKASLDTTNTINFKVFVDSELWFERESAIIPGGGFHNEEWHFWDKLPDNTPAYMAHVILHIEPHDTLLIPENGIKVWIETPVRNVDNNNPEVNDYNRPLIKIPESNILYFRDFVDIKIKEKQPDKVVSKNDKLIINDNLTININEKSDIYYNKSDNFIVNDNLTIDITENPNKKVNKSDNIIVVDAYIVNQRDIDIQKDNNKASLVIGDSLIINKEDTGNGKE